MKLRAPLLAAILAATASGAQSDLLPPIAPAFLEAELAGIVRVANGVAAKGGCSGVLVSPRHVLTAAHCSRGDHDRVVVFAPGRAAQTLIAPIQRVDLHPENRPGTTIDTVGTDIALLTLAADISGDVAAPLPILNPAPDAEHTIAGFPNGANTALHAQLACRVGRVRGTVLGSDCPVVSGFSGGPVLRETATAGGAAWGVVAITVAAVPNGESEVRALAAEIDPETFPALAEVLETLEIAPTASPQDPP